MSELVNPILIPGQSKANSLRKAMRLHRRAAGIEPPFVGHPTKKKTTGRLRNFGSDEISKKRLDNYRSILNWLFRRAQK